MSELTDEDLKFREVLTEDEWQRYSDAKKNGATEAWWVSFKKEMVVKGVKMIRELHFALTPEQIAELDEAEKKILARYDEKLE